ncbi:MAG: hypothetical protein R6V58_00990 [Planctomycetota bacterium]
MRTYNGAFEFFDASAVRTYPIGERPNRVTLGDLVAPADIGDEAESAGPPGLAAAADAVREARADGRPVILFTGAHPVKLGLGPLVVDLIERGMLTHVAGTGATAIHDFELALIGETSEDVPDALPQGRFGMARETGELINRALAAGCERGLGFGESLGRLIAGEPVPDPVDFAHPELSILAAGLRRRVPVTIHAGIGTDITDQHPSFDGAAKGGASGFDFGVYAASVAGLTGGGVVLNVGSAVTGPEVLLKAVAMAANVGRAPRGIVTADFDLRPVVPDDVGDEDRPTYYFRDHKSVVARIPAAFGGRGIYVQGNFKQTLPALYRALTAD